MKTFGMTVSDMSAARALGAPHHIVQVRAFGAAKSKAAFARSIVAAGLAPTEKWALSNLNNYGSETWNDYEVKTASASPATIFISRCDVSSKGTSTPWPQEG